MTPRALTALTAMLTLSALALATLGAACERYEPPPTPQLVGLAGNVLPDSKQPVVVRFGKPIEVASLRIKIAYFDTNLEGELPDEDADPDTSLRAVLSHDPDDGDRGGRMELAQGGDFVTLIPDAQLPVGPKLALIVEPGLRATDGRERHNRTVIPFSFAVKCSAGATANLMPSGVYFTLLEVQEPIGTQIQLFGVFDVDATTGRLTAQFTNADRNPDRGRCTTLQCGASDACRKLPVEECVAPSTKAGTVLEWSDFLPNATPPTGYSFPVGGCAIDDTGAKGAGVVTFPANMIVESPPVTVGGLEMTAFFGADEGGVVRATGTLTAQAISLGGNLIGPGKGTMSAILVPERQAPPDVPKPAPVSKVASDAGAP